MKIIPFRTIRYLLKCIPFLWVYKNWWVVFDLVINGHKKKLLKLRSGEVFMIKHYLDSLIVKEIYIDNDYRIKKNKYKVIVDIGSNIGTFSILASHYNPKARIYSYEASPSTYEVQLKNIEMNCSGNVTSHNLAVSDKNTLLTFYTHPATGLSSLFLKGRGSKKQLVNSITLSKIISGYRLKRIDFLKMDCEGAEYGILLNSKDGDILKISKMSIEYHDSLTKYKHPQLIHRLKSLGYTTTYTPHPLENEIGIIHAYKKS